MKCINRYIRKFILIFLVLITAIVVTGCGDEKLVMSYESTANLSSFSKVYGDEGRLDPFAKDLCIVSSDVISGEEIEDGESAYGAAALFDVDKKEVLYARNAHAVLYPASMTKVMTAIVAMKYGNKDDVYVASDHVLDMEDGAVICGIQPGDKITLDQAMHGLLIKSGNDAAIVIAEGISGSVEKFCELMNKEAALLGATNSHFVNPNGLHDESHVTTSYDMYLMFREATQYDWFNEIINQSNYTTSLEDSEGNKREVTWDTTNLYFKGNYDAPSNVTVIGAKSGTTSAAGNNLVLLSRDAGGNPYVSVVMRAESKDVLYRKMNNLLNTIP